MTPPTDPILATFVSELTGFEYVDGLYMWPEPYAGIMKDLLGKTISYSFFIDMAYSPIIRHLIEEAMVDRAFYEFKYTKVSGNRWEFSTTRADNRFIEQAENKTRAVALAAYRATGGKG